MILISNLKLTISDKASAIASTTIYGADKETYINIGSGIVFKLAWNTPTLTNDTVNYYVLVIKRYDPVLNVYSDIFNKNIGLVNEFFVDSPLLPPAPVQYMLSIYVAAYSKNGNIITSNIINPYISRGTGTYVNVQSDEDIAPTMTRALGFVNLAQAAASASSVMQIQTVLATIDGEILRCLDDDGEYTVKLVPLATAMLLDSNSEQFVDATGRALFAPAVKLLTSTNDWVIVQQGYVKEDEDSWQTNDLKYEVLQVRCAEDAGEYAGKYDVLYDSDTEQPIYIL